MGDFQVASWRAHRELPPRLNSCAKPRRNLRKRDSLDGVQRQTKRKPQRCFIRLEWTTKFPLDLISLDKRSCVAPKCIQFSRTESMSVLPPSRQPMRSSNVIPQQL